MNNPNKSLVKAIAIDISEDRSNLALHQLCKCEAHSYCNLFIDAYQ